MAVRPVHNFRRNSIRTHMATAHEGCMFVVVDACCALFFLICVGCSPLMVSMLMCCVHAMCLCCGIHCCVWVTRSVVDILSLQNARHLLMCLCCKLICVHTERCHVLVRRNSSSGCYRCPWDNNAFPFMRCGHTLMMRESSHIVRIHEV